MSTRRLKVIFEDGYTHDIRIGHRLMTNLGVHLRETSKASRAVVITDTDVGPLYLPTAKTGLEKAGFQVFDLTIPVGQSNKTVVVVSELWDALALMGIGRDAVIVGLGGGTVCDITGFVAANYLGGIEYALVPTTLLAMVDSAVGGRVTVNSESTKDLIGTVRQPDYVAADLRALSTLPIGEWENGYAEIAKFALLEGKGFFDWLCDNAAALLAHDEAAVQLAVVQSLSFKAQIITHAGSEQIPVEALGYGYPFARALDMIAGPGSITHGSALAEGMRFSARLAIEAIEAKAQFADRQDTLLDSLQLAPVTQAYSADELYEAIIKARNVDNNQGGFVFIKAPGVLQSTIVDPDLIKIYCILWEQARM